MDFQRWQFTRSSWRSPRDQQMGYPLAGDLTQDGFRSENWIVSMSFH